MDTPPAELIHNEENEEEEEKKCHKKKITRPGFELHLQSRALYPLDHSALPCFYHIKTRTLYKTGALNLDPMLFLGVETAIYKVYLLGRSLYRQY